MKRGIRKPPSESESPLVQGAARIRLVHKPEARCLQQNRTTVKAGNLIVLAIELIFSSRACRRSRFAFQTDSECTIFCWRHFPRFARDATQRW